MVKKIKKIIFSKMFEDMFTNGLNMIHKPIYRALDTGFGKGINTMRMRDFINPDELYGLDIFEESVEKAPEKINKIVGDLNWGFPLKSDTFDLVFSNHTIEHIINIRRYISECHRVLMKNGQLLLMTDNLCSIINIFCLILGWQPIPLVNINGWNIGNPLMRFDETKDIEFKNYQKYYQNNKIGVLGHVYVLSPSGLKDLLRRNGFKNIKVKTPGWTQFLVAHATKN